MSASRRCLLLTLGVLTAGCSYVFEYAEPTDEVCDSTTDEDLDGDVGCRDSDCREDPLCREVEHCGDGIDNDLNGAIDCQDRACLASDAVLCPEDWSRACRDGRDNDQDGFADADDADCWEIAAPTFSRCLAWPEHRFEAELRSLDETREEFYLEADALPVEVSLPGAAGLRLAPGSTLGTLDTFAVPSLGHELRVIVDGDISVALALASTAPPGVPADALEPVLRVHVSEDELVVESGGAESRARRRAAIGLLVITDVRVELLPVPGLSSASAQATSIELGATASPSSGAARIVISTRTGGMVSNLSLRVPERGCLTGRPVPQAPGTRRYGRVAPNTGLGAVGLRIDGVESFDRRCVITADCDTEGRVRPVSYAGPGWNRRPLAWSETTLAHVTIALDGSDFVAMAFTADGRGFATRSPDCDTWAPWVPTPSVNAPRSSALSCADRGEAEHDVSLVIGEPPERDTERALFVALPHAFGVDLYRQPLDAELSAATPIDYDAPPFARFVGARPPLRVTEMGGTLIAMHATDPFAPPAPGASTSEDGFLVEVRRADGTWFVPEISNGSIAGPLLGPTTFPRTFDRDGATRALLLGEGGCVSFLYTGLGDAHELLGAEPRTLAVGTTNRRSSDCLP